MRRVARGRSIRHLADVAGISHTTWSRIERGLIAADNRFTLAAIAEALECSVADITARPGAPADREDAESEVRVRAIRQALVEADLEEGTTLVPGPIATLRRETELMDDLWHHCDHSGLGQRLPRLIRELHAATFTRDRDEALALLLQAARTASRAVRDFGFPAELWLAAERCRAAARALGDPVYLALAEYERAHAAIACGAYSQGHAIAARATDHLHGRMQAPAATEMLGMLHLMCAFAALGAKRPGEIPDRLDEAQALAERTGETSTLGLMFGPTNVAFWRISMSVDGGDPCAAVELAGRTNPALVASPSRQVAFYTDTARALARTRRDERAVRMLLSAERLAPLRVHKSRLVQETARTLMERAQRRAGGVELRGLCERMGLPV